MKDADVVIVGGGIGGLTAALALLSMGQQVRVYEQSGALGEVGAGLTITPNASRVLEFLGMRDWIRDTGCLPDRGVIRNWASGEVLQVNTRREEIETRYGAPYFQVHRADLHAELAARVRALEPRAIRLGDACTGLAQRGDDACVRFATGAEIAADAVIGADGVRSTLRTALFGGEAPAYTGYVAYRGLVPAGALAGMSLDPASCLYLGPGRLFLRYLVRGGREVNFVSIARADAWTAEGWAVPASTAELLAALEGWHADVRGIAGQVGAGTLFKWGLFARGALDSWTVGRATLLGDAAHPLLPFLGQGAVMAIEDAAVLARAFAAADTVPEALARYERARVGRANRVMALSREGGLRLVSQATGAYTAGRFTSAGSLGLMDYDPLTIPV